MRQTVTLSVLVSLWCALCLFTGCERSTQADLEVSKRGTGDVVRPHRVDAAQVEEFEEVAAIDPARRAELERLLGGFEHNPSSEDLHAVEGDDDRLRALLIDLHEDQSVRRGVRQRALATLQYAPGEATNAYYEAKLRDTATRNPDRRLLIKAYANAAGPAAEATLIEQLSHSDATTRAFSAEALGKLATAQAISALEARARVEQVELVRQRIGAALGRDPGTAPAPQPAQGAGSSEDVK